MINVLTCNNNLYSDGHKRKLRCVLKFCEILLNIIHIRMRKKTLESDMPHLKLDPCRNTL